MHKYYTGGTSASGNIRDKSITSPCSIVSGIVRSSIIIYDKGLSYWSFNSGQDSMTSGRTCHNWWFISHSSPLFSSKLDGMMACNYNVFLWVWEMKIDFGSFEKDMEAKPFYSNLMVGKPNWNSLPSSLSTSFRLKKIVVIFSHICIK